MKISFNKLFQSITAVLVVNAAIGFNSGGAQTIPYAVATFEEYTSSLAADQVEDGSKGNTNYNFNNGLLIMSTSWDTSFGGYFQSGGWAFSRKNYYTVEPSDFSKHLYAASAGKGYELSDVYAIGSNTAHIKLNRGVDTAWNFFGFQLTNTTFARNSMLFGDAFAKKFNAADRDSFVLIISGFRKGELKKSKRVMLADFRDADPGKHFILSNWEFVEFNEIVDSVRFDMESSDNSSWGMNTPAYFAIDNIELSLPGSVKNISTLPLKLFPNPASGQVKWMLPENERPQSIKITNLMGAVMLNQSPESNGVQFESQISNELDLQRFPAGIYLVEVESQTQKRYVSKLQVVK